MKRILFSLVLACITVLSLYAQTFNYDFPKDDEGEPFITGTIAYDCGAETAVKRITSYINSTFEKVSIDDAARTISIKGAEINAKFSYNPFAGEFSDNIIFDLTITWPGNGTKEFTYTLSNLRVHSTAKGFANYDNNDPLRQVLRKYDRAKERLNDGSLNKKEKKEAINEEKDLGETLSKIVETLNEQVHKITESLE